MREEVLIQKIKSVHRQVVSLGQDLLLSAGFGLAFRICLEFGLKQGSGLGVKLGLGLEINVVEAETRGQAEVKVEDEVDRSSMGCS